MNNEPLKEIALPLAYFITFTCYGTWLHGDKYMSVNSKNNQVEMPYLPGNALQENSAKNRMIEPAYYLETLQRKIVLHSIQEVCAYHQWSLLAVHVRTNHVHVVVHGLTTPENILNSFKTYSSRKLNQSQREANRTKRWTRHGSTRYLWKPEQVESCIQYVVYEQGELMAVYENIDRILIS